MHCLKVPQCCLQGQVPLQHRYLSSPWHALSREGMSWKGMEGMSWKGMEVNHVPAEPSMLLEHEAAEMVQPLLVQGLGLHQVGSAQSWLW